MAKYKITDHARIRYITRICGVSIRDIDRAVLKEEQHEIVIEGKTVVTVIKKNNRKKNRTRRRNRE